MIQATIVLTVKANFSNQSCVTNFAHEAERAIRRVVAADYQNGIIESSSVVVTTETEGPV